MNSKSFSQKIINEYVNKINSSSSLEQLHDYFSNSKEWIDWLRSNKKIDANTYKEIKRLLVKQVENRSQQLNNNPIVKKKSKTFIFIVTGLFLILSTILLLYLNNWFGASFTSKDQIFKESPDKRVLPFRGILKDADGNAIDTKQDVYFAIYNSPIEGSPLYSGLCVGENGITPEYNGVFTVTLGTDCGMMPISGAIFNKNGALYLGVRIGNEEEIQPRYKISTSGYSQDTALLGGLPAGKINSSIPYIDESGAIVIDAESPSIRSTEGTFSLQGKILSLQTSEDVAGNIMFQPGIGGHTIVTSGNFGLGDLTPTTRLSIIGIEPYSAIASIKNLALVDEPETSVLDLGLATSIDGSNSTFVNFYAGATKDAKGELVGSIQLNNKRVVYQTSGADIAEYFNVSIINTFEPGTVMTLSSDGIHAGQPSETVVGVVTDSAGYIGNMTHEPNQILVGLVGQIEVLVSNIHGSIQKGDRIGLSSISGYGAKAIDDRETVGFSLEDMEFDSGKFSNDQCPKKYRKNSGGLKDLVRCGKIFILLRPM